MAIRVISLACAGLILLLGTASSLATGDDEPDDRSLSWGTSTLLGIIKQFHRLDEAVANQMEDNERHLLAVAMVRLSSGFYGLMQSKHAFVSFLDRDEPITHMATYSETVAQLKDSVTCLAAQFAGDGHRILVFTNIDGPKVVEDLQRGLDEKVASLDQLAKDLGIHPEGGDLKAVIRKDAKRADDAALKLSEETARFARVLDPHVIAPEHPKPCVKPSS